MLARRMQMANSTENESRLLALAGADMSLAFKEVTYEWASLSSTSTVHSQLQHESA